MKLFFINYKIIFVLLLVSSSQSGIQGSLGDLRGTIRGASKGFQHIIYIKINEFDMPLCIFQSIKGHNLLDSEKDCHRQFIIIRQKYHSGTGTIN